MVDLRYTLLCGFFVSSLLLAGCGDHPAGSSKLVETNTNAANPTPSIIAITPESVIAGSDSQTLTLTGTGFVPSSLVNFNTVAVTGRYVSASTLTVSVPAALIAADGRAEITVTNPLPGGGVSPPFDFPITIPKPVLTSLSPQVVSQGSAAVITITGTGFEANSVAVMYGVRPTTFVNSTTLKVALSALDLKDPGTRIITVVNPSVDPAAPLQLSVLAFPVISSVSPTSQRISPDAAAPVSLTLYGAAFAPNSMVQANGTQLPISEIDTSSTAPHIIVTLSPSFLEIPGDLTLTVTNPGTLAMTSNPVVFRVLPPRIGLGPSSAPVGSPDVPLSIHGNFFPDSVVRWNGVAMQSTYVSPTELSAVIPASWLSVFVNASVTVFNPEDRIQASPVAFSTFLPLWLNDIAYNKRDGLIYASVSDHSGSSGYANNVVGIDPISATIRSSVLVGTNPNRLALSDDGTQLFVGVDGESAVSQLDLTTGQVGATFPLPKYFATAATPKAVSIVSVPDRSGSIAVFDSNAIATIYDAGSARPNYVGVEGAGLEFPGAITFGGDASTLFITDNSSFPAFKGGPAINGYLYRFTVNSTGIDRGYSRISYDTGGPALTAALNFQGSFRMQYENGLLYLPSGRVYDGTAGKQVGQILMVDPSTGLLVAATGPTVSDSTLNRVWVWTNNGLMSYDAKTYHTAGAVDVSGGPYFPFLSQDFYDSMRYHNADLIRWGQDGLAFHTPAALFVLSGVAKVTDSSSPAKAPIAK